MKAQEGTLFVRHEPICLNCQQAGLLRYFFLWGSEMIEWNGRKYRCPMEMAMDVLSGKWKCLMLNISLYWFR